MGYFTLSPLHVALFRFTLLTPFARLQDMIQALGKNGHSEAGLRQAVQALSGDGLIYSTIDVEKFKYAL